MAFKNYILTSGLNVQCHSLNTIAASIQTITLHGLRAQKPCNSTFNEWTGRQTTEEREEREGRRPAEWTHTTTHCLLPENSGPERDKETRPHAGQVQHTLGHHKPNREEEVGGREEGNGRPRESQEGERLKGGEGGGGGLNSRSRPGASGCGFPCTAIAMDTVAIGDGVASDVTFEAISTRGRYCLNQVT